jgi:hypothetical protein
MMIRTLWVQLNRFQKGQLSIDISNMMMMIITLMMGA